MVAGAIGGALLGNEVQKKNEQPIAGQQIIVRLEQRRAGSDHAADGTCAVGGPAGLCPGQRRERSRRAPAVVRVDRDDRRGMAITVARCCSESRIMKPREPSWPCSSSSSTRSCWAAPPSHRLHAHRQAAARPLAARRRPHQRAGAGLPATDQFLEGQSDRVPRRAGDQARRRQGRELRRDRRHGPHPVRSGRSHGHLREHEGLEDRLPDVAGSRRRLYGPAADGLRQDPAFDLA